jgi:hypothetical protein
MAARRRGRGTGFRRASERPALGLAGPALVPAGLAVVLMGLAGPVPVSGGLAQEDRTMSRLYGRIPPTGGADS